MTDDASLPDLFAEASERTEADRERFLEGIAADSPALAAELRSLLAQGRAGERELRGTAWDRLAAEDSAAEALPERIGPYRVLGELGRGGMGRVYLAEEEREAFTRRLALKVLDRHGDSPDRLRRFRSEVRILASLEHPGIARFLEGGRLADGTWFLALEYVDGADLVTYARAGKLPVEGRVRLVLEVLAAIAYAHAEGVVHRDIKPGNILVDRHGAARLLDFGVAKLFEEETGGAPEETVPELRHFTPAYASPEQFTGDAVGAASDVYSTGVVLYELLAGGRPFGSATGSRGELEREVLSGPLTAPSVRLKAMPLTSPPLAIDRELDAICLRALQREPGERYPSALAFAADLERYLAHQPVEAARGAWRSGLRRALRREVHLKGALASVAGAALLFAGLAWFAAGGADRRAGPPSDPAPRPFPYSAANVPPAEELRQRFDREPANLEAGAALAIALVREQHPEEAALIVARLRQIPAAAGDPLVDYVEATLAVQRGAPQQALILFERALSEAIAGARGELVAQIRAARGRLLGTLGRRFEARQEMERAAQAFEVADDPATLARVLNDLAIESAQSNDLDEARRLLERALAATRAASPTNTGATFLGNLANIDMLRGRPDLAEARYREVVGIFHDLARPPRESLWAQALAISLWEQGRAGAARSEMDRAIELGRPAAAPSRVDVALQTRAAWSVEGGEPDDAARHLAEIDRLVHESGDPEASARAEVLRGLLERAAGRPTAALDRYAAARRLFAGAGAAEQLVELDLEEADLRLEIGDLAASRGLVEASVSPLGGHGDRAAWVRGELLLARLDLRRGDPAAAAKRLAPLRGRSEVAHMVGLQIELLRAEAELAQVRRDPEGAARAYESAISLAHTAERRATAAALRRALAAVRAAPTANTL